MNHLNIRISLIILLLCLLAVSIFAQSEITITAKQNLALQSKPDYDSDVLGIFQRGQEAAAFGRDEAGAWLQINDGWVVAKNVDADSDIMALPVTTNAVTIKAAASRSLRSGPDDSFDATGNLPSGETALALGRNGDGSWLQVSGGWIPADQVEISGDVMALPITFSSITIYANINVALHRGPSRDAEVLAILARGEEAVATSRNETGTALQTPQGWVFVNRGLALEGEIMELPLAPTVSVTAVQALTVYSGPSQDYFERLAVVKQGEQNIAFGRDENGDWLQIPGGWVSAEQGLETRGDIMALPITGQARQAEITVTATTVVSARSESRINSIFIRNLRRGEKAIAIGRNEAGTYLQIESGWVLASLVKADGDVMALPVISGESSTQSTVKASSRDGITITLTRFDSLPVRNAPRSDVSVRFLQKGEEALAIGRNEDGKWLQIEDGWVYGDYFRVDGNIMDLPILGITITANIKTGIRSGPSERGSIGFLQRGEEAIAFGRNEKATRLQIESGWVIASYVKADGDIMLLPVTSGESSTQSIVKASPRNGVTIISMSSNTPVRTRPSSPSARIRRLPRDEEAIAIGRNERGDWLQIEDGWVNASWVRSDGDTMALPVTSGESSTQSVAKASPRNGVTITPTLPRSSILSGPGSVFDMVGSLRRGEEAPAIGRNEAGTYLQIEDGWVFASWVKVDGDIMSLPVTSSTAVRTTTTSTGRATPTPTRSSSSTSAFNEQSIRSQVNRYTDDIRILKISQSGSTTEIEYDLKPWPFVPNEQIAHEVLFKMICALRRGGQIPHKLEFTGQGHFKSDVGRKFKSPSVEIHISANNANRVICSGNTYSDINWRSLASRYRSYPIPSGARVDYG